MSADYQPAGITQVGMPASTTSVPLRSVTYVLVERVMTKDLTLE